MGQQDMKLLIQIQRLLREAQCDYSVNPAEPLSTNLDWLRQIRASYSAQVAVMDKGIAMMLKRKGPTAKSEDAVSGFLST
jgi:hypothetical protein